MYISDSTIIHSSFIGGYWTGTVPHNADEDKVFYCLANNFQGVLFTRASCSAILVGWEPKPIVPPDPLPTNPIKLWQKDPLPPPVTSLVIRSSFEAEFITEYIKKNHIAWSKIGEADFTLDEVNDAGWRALPWPGWVYQVKPLGNKIVVYGEGGVSFLVPNSLSTGSGLITPTFGHELVYTSGLLAKNAICGNDKVHVFIDSIGQLCKLTEQGVQPLGFEEFMLPLKHAGKPIVMFYETNKQWVYICNGTKGYILTPQGLGSGPKNLTGLGYLGTTPILASNGELEFDLPYFVSDVINLGGRDQRCLYQICVGASYFKELEAKIEHRLDIRKPFLSTSWRNFNSKGECFFNISGSEFKVHVRSKTSDEIAFDDFRIYIRSFARTLNQEFAGRNQ